MSRANRMSGKYGEDDDFQQPSARRRAQQEDVVEDADPPSSAQMQPNGITNLEEKMQAKASGRSSLTGVVPSGGRSSADLQMKMNKIVRSSSSGKKLAAASNELPEYAEVQAPPDRLHGSSSNNLSSNGSALVPGAVAVLVTTRAPSGGEKGLSRASSGGPTAAARANADGPLEKDAARLSVGAVAVQTSESQKKEKDLARAPAGAAVLRASANSITEMNDFAEQFDDEPSEDFIYKTKMRTSVSSKALRLDTSLIPPPEAPNDTAAMTTTLLEVNEPLDSNSQTMPGALRISGQHITIEDDDFEDSVAPSYDGPQTVSLPAATPVLDEEQLSLVIPGSIQEAFPDTGEELAVRKGMLGWIETHQLRSLIIIIVLVGAIIGGLVGGLAQGGSSIPIASAPSAAPTTTEYGTIFSVISQLTLPDVLQDPSTPQNAALRWMVEVGSFNTTDEVKILQRYALVTLYYSTQGDAWVDQLKFLTDTDECDWNDGSPDFFGAVCNEEGEVKKILLPSHNLEGPIPAELSALSSLLFLSMFNNKLTGSIPSNIGDMTQLTVLSIRRNRLTGRLPDSLGNLTLLTWLFTSENQLTGPIPDSLGNLTLLTQLFTSENQLTGPIPTSMGQLANLVTWYNNDNQMSGQAPLEMEGMISLTTLYLEGNEFTGTMEPFCINTTVLSEFKADCSESELLQMSPEVVCPCCSHCNR